MGLSMATEIESQPRLVDQQHRVHIPNEILDALGVTPGKDYVQFTADGAHGIRIHKVRWIREAGKK